MPNQPSVEQMFEYNPDGINLKGFPYSPVLDGLQRVLRLEILLKEHQKHLPQRQRVINPSFPPEYINDRQDFFRRVASNHRIKKNFFNRGLPDTRDLRIYGRYERFLELCDEIYEISATARTELATFNHMPEAQRILSGIGEFDKSFGTMVEKLKEIEDLRTFAIDTERGIIARISEMPEGRGELLRDDPKEERYGEIFNEVRARMKKQALKVAENVQADFRRGVINYVKDVFRFRPDGVRNLRKDFEQLALPTRLHTFYGKLLEACEEYPEALARDFLDEEWEVEMWRGSFDQLLQDEFGMGLSPMPDPVYPSFGKNYDIQGLFPPRLMTERDIYEPFVPINFNADSSERKFLLAGLHSGGKSFFLENIVLTSVLAQMGVDIPADSLTLPKYQNIHYYRNVDNSNGEGKLETELREINGIIKVAGEGDLVVIDEFLDSASVEIANSLGPAILDKLVNLGSTVFVTSHRSTNYDQLSRDGWTLMSPDYEIQDKKVRPKLTLSRGPPDSKINERYVLERYSGIFGIESD